MNYTQCFSRECKFIQNSRLDISKLKSVEVLWKESIYPLVSALKSRKSQDLAAFSLSQIGFFHQLLLLLGITLPWKLSTLSANGSNLENGTFGGCVDGCGLLGIEPVAIAKTLELSFKKEVGSKIFLYLGDLSRYLQDFNNSIVYYSSSLALSHSSNALNQLGVVYHQIGQISLAFFFYTRALLHTSPFLAAKGNLDLISSKSSIIDAGDEWKEQRFPVYEFTQRSHLVLIFNFFAFSSLDVQSNFDIHPLVHIENILARFDEFELFHLFLLVLNNLELISSEIRASICKWSLTHPNSHEPLDEDDPILVSKEINREIRDCSLYSTLRTTYTIGSYSITECFVSILRRIGKEFGGVTISQSPIPMEVMENPIEINGKHEKAQPSNQNDDEEDEEDVVTFKRFKTSNLPKAQQNPIGSERKPFSPSQVIGGQYLLFPPSTPIMSQPPSASSSQDSLLNLGQHFTFHLNAKDK